MSKSQVKLVLAGDDPPGAQIIEQLERLIALGAYDPGHRLPSAADLAVQLGVSHVTVQKAYGVLVERGAVESRIGDGTFVLEIGAARQGFLGRSFAPTILLGCNLQMTRAEIVKAFESQIARHFAGSRRDKTTAK